MLSTEPGRGVDSSPWDRVHRGSEVGVCHGQEGAVLCYLAQTPGATGRKLKCSGWYSDPAPEVLQRLRRGNLKFRACLGQPE